MAVFLHHYVQCSLSYRQQHFVFMSLLLQLRKPWHWRGAKGSCRIWLWLCIVMKLYAKHLTEVAALITNNKTAFSLRIVRKFSLDKPDSCGCSSSPSFYYWYPLGILFKVASRNNFSTKQYRKTVPPKQTERFMLRFLSEVESSVVTINESVSYSCMIQKSRVRQLSLLHGIMSVLYFIKEEYVKHPCLMSN